MDCALYFKYIIEGLFLAFIISYTLRELIWREFNLANSRKNYIWRESNLVGGEKKTLLGDMFFLKKT